MDNPYTSVLPLVSRRGQAGPLSGSQILSSMASKRTQGFEATPCALVMQPAVLVCLAPTPVHATSLEGITKYK